eukprot:1290216-Rhodomonas_salina.3
MECGVWGVKTSEGSKGAEILLRTSITSIVCSTVRCVSTGHCKGLSNRMLFLYRVWHSAVVRSDA